MRFKMIYNNINPHSVARYYIDDNEVSWSEYMNKLELQQAKQYTCLLVDDHIEGNGTVTLTSVYLDRE